VSSVAIRARGQLGNTGHADHRSIIPTYHARVGTQGPESASAVRSPVGMSFHRHRKDPGHQRQRLEILREPSRDQLEPEVPRGSDPRPRTCAISLDWREIPPAAGRPLDVGHQVPRCLWANLALRAGPGRLGQRTEQVVQDAGAESAWRGSNTGRPGGCPDFSPALVTAGVARAAASLSHPPPRRATDRRSCASPTG